MKKLLPFCILSFVFCIGVSFAYTSSDIDNANFLADQGIIVKQANGTNYRLDDTITRAEVAGIALKLAGVSLPNNYACKKYFTDVTKNDWICRAVEMAADRGYVSRANAKYRPQDKITRAEALAILVAATNMRISEPRRVAQSDGSVWSLYEDLKSSGFTQWQADLMDSVNICGIVGVSCQDGAEMNMAIGKFAPNRNATRAEVFGFARNILKLKEMMSGEVGLYPLSTYENTKYGFELEYPATWKYREFSYNIDGIAFCSPEINNCGELSENGSLPTTLIVYPYEFDKTGGVQENSTFHHNFKNYNQNGEILASMDLLDSKYQDEFIKIRYSFRFTN